MPRGAHHHAEECEKSSREERGGEPDGGEPTFRVVIGAAVVVDGREHHTTDNDREGS